MAEHANNGQIVLKKKGGYQGGRPAEPVPPPPKAPSGSSVGAAARERAK